VVSLSDGTNFVSYDSLVLAPPTHSNAEYDLQGSDRPESYIETSHFTSAYGLNPSCHLNIVTRPLSVSLKSGQW